MPSAAAVRSWPRAALGDAGKPGNAEAVTLQQKEFDWLKVVNFRD